MCGRIICAARTAKPHNFFQNLWKVINVFTTGRSSPSSFITFIKVLVFTICYLLENDPCNLCVSVYPTYFKYPPYLGAILQSTTGEGGTVCSDEKEPN